MDGGGTIETQEDEGRASVLVCRSTAKRQVLQELSLLYLERAANILRWLENLSLVFQLLGLGCALAVVIVSRFQDDCSQGKGSFSVTSDVLFAVGLVEVLLNGLQALADRAVSVRAALEATRKAENLSNVASMGDETRAAAATAAAMPSFLDRRGPIERWFGCCCCFRTKGKGLFAPTHRESQLWQTWRMFDRSEFS